MERRTIAQQIQDIDAKSPGMDNTELARILGCSRQMVSMVRQGKRGTKEYEDAGVDVDAENAAFMALEAARQSLQLQMAAEEAKEKAFHSENGLKNAKAWALFAGKATNRSPDRDEDITDAEAEEIAKKFLHDHGRELAEGAENFLKNG